VYPFWECRNLIHGAGCEYAPSGSYSVGVVRLAADAQVVCPHVFVSQSEAHKDFVGNDDDGEDYGEGAVARDVQGHDRRTEDDQLNPQP
jgi:hypothetical protein